MASIGVSVDVPNLADGVKFYCEAFGFTKKAEPFPGLAILDAGGATMCILEKAAGSKPAQGSEDVRRYERHWTPVHLDIHVDDLDAAIARAVTAGAVTEQVHKHPGHGSAAFCADPFGNGFCLIENRKK